MVTAAVLIGSAGSRRRPTMFADFVMVALAVPSIVLVLLGYGLLAAALVANLRNKIAWQRHSPARRVPADG
jgi:hypothetical protein